MKILYLVSSLLLMSGCSTPQPDTDSSSETPKPPAQTTERLGSHQVTIRPGSNHISKTKVIFSYTLTVGETKVVIHNKELSVNGINYGALQKGDPIFIATDSVTVAGKVRQPQPSSP